MNRVTRRSLRGYTRLRSSADSSDSLKKDSSYLDRTDSGRYVNESAPAPVKARILARVLLLGTLLGFTVVAPLSGLIGPDMSLAMPTRTTVAANMGTSWSALPASVHADSGLLAVPGAAAQARVKTAVSDSACLPENAANGDHKAGASEEKLFWPLKKGTFVETSPFGYRTHPIYGASKLHEGVDLAAPAGTSVHAVANGQVLATGEVAVSGQRITIKHERDGQVFYSQYLHLLTGSIKVEVGQQVQAGQVIAGVGSTGMSTGNHLHFEIRPDLNTPIDPITWMGNQKAVYVGQTCQ